jgi:tRNA threonylcarbamoyladenosine biosynthesis protein TsaB
MSAKVFAYATGCAVIAVDTFDAIADQAPAEVERLDVLADAQQDRVYVQGYARPAAGAGLRSESPLRIERFADWLGAREPAAWVTGPGLRVLHARLPPDVPVVAAELWDPGAESLVSLGLARYRDGTRDDLWTLEPLYLRPSSAEEQWRGK